MMTPLLLYLLTLIFHFAAPSLNLFPFPILPLSCIEGAFGVSSGFRGFLHPSATLDLCPPPPQIPPAGAIALIQGCV